LAHVSTKLPLRQFVITISYITPSEYAFDELALWQRALQEQRDAESSLEEARKGRQHARILELMPQVQTLRTTADLLLAEAVKVMRSFQEMPVITEWLTTGSADSLGID
jgi:hypothetical protein